MEVVAFYARGGLLETDVVEAREAGTIYILQSNEYFVTLSKG